MPTDTSDEKFLSNIALLPPPPQKRPIPLTAENITLYTTMFLSLLKGVGDWRNVVAADTVQSVWQSPPMIDFSQRLFGT